MRTSQFFLSYLTPIWAASEQIYEVTYNLPEDYFYEQGTPLSFEQMAAISGTTVLIRALDVDQIIWSLFTEPKFWEMRLEVYDKCIFKETMELSHGLFTGTIIEEREEPRRRMGLPPQKYQKELKEDSSKMWTILLKQINILSCGDESTAGFRLTIAPAVIVDFPLPKITTQTTKQAGKGVPNYEDEVCADDDASE